jgi:hypothetical protein
MIEVCDAESAWRGVLGGPFTQNCGAKDEAGPEPSSFELFGLREEDVLADYWVILAEGQSLRDGFRVLASNIEKARACAAH